MNDQRLTPDDFTPTCPYCLQPMTDGTEDDYVHKEGKRFAHTACVATQGRPTDPVQRGKLRERYARPKLKAGGSDYPSVGKGGRDWGYYDD